MEDTKFTETKEFKLMVAEELLVKAQMELDFLESETTGEAMEQVDSIKETVSKAILFIREC